MTSERPLRLLLDTNVWLDNYVPTRTGHETVKRLMTHAVEQEAVLLYAAPTAKDVFYMMARFIKAEARRSGECTDADARAATEIAWAVVENMDLLATPVAVDVADVWLAKKYRSIHADFEDNLVLVASKRAKADYLVTSDDRLLVHAPVAAVSPAAMLELLDQGLAR